MDSPKRSMGRFIHKVYEIRIKQQINCHQRCIGAVTRSCRRGPHGRGGAGGGGAEPRLEAYVVFLARVALDACLEQSKVKATSETLLLRADSTCFVCWYLMIRACTSHIQNMAFASAIPSFPEPPVPIVSNRSLRGLLVAHPWHIIYI